MVVVRHQERLININAQAVTGLSDLRSEQGQEQSRTQIPHVKEHISLNFPPYYSEHASPQDKAWQVLSYE